ncbi:MAG TPA: fibronectin type III domain-containing protein, partial [Thermoanaerobaculia bacterium]
SVTLTGLEAGTTYFWSVLAKTPCNLNSVGSAVQSFTTRTDCLPPGTPTITFSPTGNIGIRQTYVITWSDATGLSADGQYIIERSTSDAFTTILDSQRTRATFASFVAPAGGTYYHRVRAIPGCDPNKASLNSAVRSVVAVGGKPNVIFTVQPSPVITTLGDTLANKTTSFALENLDDAPINVLITTQEPREFFSVVDPTDPTAFIVTLQPRAPKRFEVRFAGPPTNVADAYQGIIVVTSTGTALNLTPYAFVNLKIGGADTATPRLRINGVQTEYAFFPPFGAGDDSARPPLSIDIVNPGNTSMEIGAEIGPELWLSIDAGWNAAPILPGASLTVPLRTKRLLALNGSALPRYTYFTIRTKSGQSARLLVQDNDQSSVGTGRPSSLEPGERSYIVPLVMAATSSNNRKLASRVRLSNVGGDSVQADLYYTPPDTDGFDPALVKKLTILVPPNDIVTLTDPLVQLFGLSAPARGQLEIRAPREKIGLLNVTSAVTSGSEGLGAFGFDVPTVLRGEGAKAGAPQVILGVTSNSDVVTDLILAETSGTDAATVRCVLFNQSGAQQGELAVAVPRYGFHKIDNVVSALGGTESLEGGRIEIRVESGGGVVVGIAAFTDRLFDSAATIASRPFGNAAAIQQKALARFKGMAPNAVTTVTMLVPVVVNGTLGSAANSYSYRTGLQLTAPAGASASFTLTFRNALGGTPIIRNVTVPAGTTTSYANVLEQLFNLLVGSNARGQVLIDTSSGDVTARLSSFSPVTSTWATVSNIEVLSPSSERFTGASLTMQRPIYIDGLEQSTDATRGRRWMLLINEIDGQPVTARVRMYEAGNRSLPISDKEFSIAALSQFTLDTVFSAMDLNMAGDRQKDRTNVLCVVSASSGTGRISAVALGTDNVTGDTRVYTLTPNGGLPATGLLTVTPIRPLPGEILDPNPRVSS